jgi:hypothetical protein
VEIGGEFMECQVGRTYSGLMLAARITISPFLGFLREVFSEIRRRTGKCHGTKLREPRLELSIGEARIDLGVELIDDLGGRALGGADAIPRTRVVTGDEIGDNRNVGQRQGAW